MKLQKKIVALLLTSAIVITEVMPIMATELSEEVVTEENNTVVETSFENLTDIQDDGEIPVEVSEKVENDIEEETKEETQEDTFEICGIPEDRYVLSTEQLEEKSDLYDTVEGIKTAVPGEDYVDGEIFFFADSEEEADLVAKALGGEVISFSYGVAVASMDERLSVEEAVTLSEDCGLNIPALYPNYYRHETDNMCEEVLIEADQISELTGEAMDMDPYTFSESSYYQWHHDVIGSQAVWQLGYTGSDICVAVLDTGLSTTTNEFSGKVISESTGFDSNGNTISYEDGRGHGTHVAGIIAGACNNVMGQGVAYNAKLQIVKVLDDYGNGTDAAIMKGLQYVADKNKAQVVNMSLGGYFANSAYKQKIDNLYNKGIAVIVAAGNDDTSNYSYPAAYPSVITVACTMKDNTKASYSNYGNWIDVCAPGDKIWSASNVDNCYVSKSGTSMACPVVAGEVALILSAFAQDSSTFPQLVGKTKGAKVDALENILEGNVIKSDKNIGAGIPSLIKIFNVADSMVKPNAPTVYGYAVNNNQEAEFCISTSRGNEVRYTIDGTDPSKAGANYNSSYSSSFTIKCEPDASSKTPDTITLTAVAVNSVGLVGPAKKVSVKLKPYVKSINILGPSKIASGKTASYSTDVLPKYATNKKVDWNIYKESSSVPLSADQQKTAGVCIKAGRVSVDKMATSGAYIIEALATDGSGVIAKKTIYIAAADVIKNVKFNDKKCTVYRYDSNVSVNMLSSSNGHFTVEYMNGSTSAVASDFVWTSNKPEVATVNASGIVTCVGPGTATITAMAADSSGKKATISIEVIQRVTSLSIIGADAKIGDTHYVSASKTIAFKEVVEPKNAANKKVTWKLFTASGTEITKNNANLYGMSISNGKVSTKNTASNGEYYVTATTLDGSGITAKYTFYVVSSQINSVVVYKNKATKEDYSNVSVFRVPGGSNAATSADIKYYVTGSGYDISKFKIIVGNPDMIQVNSSSLSTATGVVTVSISATGNMYGKTTVTLCSIDGSSKKAAINVNVVNPPSSVKLSTKRDYADAVAIGNKITIYPTFGTGYGTISNKKLSWSVSGIYANYASISSSGVLSISKYFPYSYDVFDEYGNLIDDIKLYVTATTTDGSNVSDTIEIIVAGSVIKSIYYIPLLSEWNSSNGYKLYHAIGVRRSSDYDTFYNVSIVNPNQQLCTAYYDNECGVLVVQQNNHRRGKVTIKVTVTGCGVKKTISMPYGF